MVNSAPSPPGTLVADGSNGAAGAPAAATGKPSGLNKRGPVACKRCRRAKTKCLHPGAPPCRACSESGLASECVFPPKGTSFVDRAPVRRAKRSRDDSEDAAGGASFVASPIEGSPTSEPTHIANRTVASPTQTITSLSTSPSATTHLLSQFAPWGPSPVDLLPPLRLIEAASEVYFTQVNQCAFLHRPTFTLRLRDPANPINPVLLFAMCALAAPFLPPLAEFCAANNRPTSYLADTGRMLLFAGIDEPTVDACRAAYILGFADWGASKGRRSWMLHGIALRMAFLLGLHREETHALPKNPTPAQLISVEEAKRTFWSLFINDCVFSSGHARPPSIVPSEITISLPCDEDSFAFGTPSVATYLSQPAEDVAGAPPSIMASMVRSVELWGRAARWACDIRRRDAVPSDPQSEYAQLRKAILAWRIHLPERLQYSRPNLSIYLQRNLERAMIYIHATHYAAEIMLRRPYLPYIIRSVAPPESGISLNNTIIPWDPAPPPKFWIQCGHEMFAAALHIVDIISDLTTLTQANLSPHLGFSAFLATATLTYVWRWPFLLPDKAHEIPAIVTKSTEILSSLIPNWPMARQWVRVLRQPLNKRIDEAVQDDVATDQREGIFRQKDDLVATSVSSTPEEEAVAAMPSARPLAEASTWGSAPSLHALAHIATDPGYTLPATAVPTLPDNSLFGSLQDPYTNMPFGDPTQPPLDVLSFMDGVDQWNWPR